jgi:alkylation response protein AidB-like acyl-CoA dehydrogenase
VDLEPSAEQSALIDVFESIAARYSTTAVVRATETTGFAPELWSQLVGAGVPAIAVAEAAGGTGGDLLDVALGIEVLGRHLAPVPLVEHTVAARLLATIGDAPPDVVAGTTIASIALRPASDGVATLVPAGAVAGVVVALDDDDLVATDSAAPGEAVANLACAPLAHRLMIDVRVLASGDDALRAHEQALAEWRALTASALVGAGYGALALGIEYVTQRHQFGRPIGSFQAIQHTLADVSVALDGAQLLARKACWALDQQAGNAHELAAMALVFAAEHSQRASERALHFHGGYGFMQEYDIQLYYRRAKGWPLVIDSVPRELERLASRRYGGA